MVNALHSSLLLTFVPVILISPPAFVCMWLFLADLLHPAFLFELRLPAPPLGVLRLSPGSAWHSPSLPSAPTRVPFSNDLMRPIESVLIRVVGCKQQKPILANLNRKAMFGQFIHLLENGRVRLGGLKPRLMPQDFPDGPLAKTLRSQCRGLKFDPLSEN